MSSWFGGTSSVGRTHDQRSQPQSQSHSHSHRRTSSPARSSSRHYVGESSSTRGIFSLPRTSSSSSSYKRRPRDGYIARMVYKIKRMLRDLMSYARRNPMKVFMLVVMPLLTGGALHSVLRQFGIKLPTALAGFGGGSGFGGRGGGMGEFGGGGGGGGGGIQNLLSIAKMFM